MISVKPRDQCEQRDQCECDESEQHEHETTDQNCLDASQFSEVKKKVGKIINDSLFDQMKADGQQFDDVQI